MHLGLGLKTHNLPATGSESHTAYSPSPPRPDTPLHGGPARREALLCRSAGEGLACAIL